ncbi:hypothetical protein THRCLA_01714 [Thraustotheca clavata]|uniref:Uncharacterized protein n=1 Tax=Thraustotheca clavata TaxID=74557 RepID=A0A1W0A7S4_9STRA|nr:hypothetical protein THRCLA_01714 [Thraustotheca clavata]
MRELEQVVNELKANGNANAVREICHLALDKQSSEYEWARSMLLDTMRLHAPPAERTSLLSFGTQESLKQNVIKQHIIAALENKNVALKSSTLMDLQFLIEEGLYGPETMEMYLELAPIVATHPKVCRLIPLLENHLCQHIDMFSFNWKLYAQWPNLWKYQIELWMKATQDTPFKSVYSIMFKDAPDKSVEKLKYSLYLHVTARQFLARALQITLTNFTIIIKQTMPKSKILRDLDEFS